MQSNPIKHPVSSKISGNSMRHSKAPTNILLLRIPSISSFSLLILVFNAFVCFSRWAFSFFELSNSWGASRLFNSFSNCIFLKIFGSYRLICVRKVDLIVEIISSSSRFSSLLWAFLYRVTASLYWLIEIPVFLSISDMSCLRSKRCISELPTLMFISIFGKVSKSVYPLSFV